MRGAEFSATYQSILLSQAHGNIHIGHRRRPASCMRSCVHLLIPSSVPSSMLSSIDWFIKSLLQSAFHSFVRPSAHPPTAPMSPNFGRPAACIAQHFPVARHARRGIQCHLTTRSFVPRRTGTSISDIGPLRACAHVFIY